MEREGALWDLFCELLARDVPAGLPPLPVRNVSGSAKWLRTRPPKPKTRCPATRNPETRKPESYLQKNLIHKPGFNQNYCTFALILLMKIVLGSKFS